MSEIVKYEEQVDYLQTLIDSKSIPSHIKTPQQAFLIAQMGKELGIPTLQAFKFIIPIQGQLTLSAKCIGALLRKSGVSYRTVEDAVWVYPDESTSKVNKGGAIDRRTTIEFTRNGVVEEVSFSWLDAKAQDLTEKSNYKRLPVDMLFARAMSRGANRVAPDALMGMYSSDELFDSIGDERKTQVKRDEDGTILEVIETEYTEA